MMQNSGRNVTSQDAPTSSYSPNQQQQPRLLNRMSDFLFQKRQGSYGQDDYSEASSSSPSGLMASSIGGAPSTYSAMDEDNASRVDSMFSSIQSNQSNLRVNPNTPPPVRTVRLDGGIVHRANNAPPSPTQHPVTSPVVEPSTSSHYNESTINTIITGKDNGSPSQASSFDQAFEKMAVSLWIWWKNWVTNVYHSNLLC